MNRTYLLLHASGEACKCSKKVLQLRHAEMLLSAVRLAECVEGGGELHSLALVALEAEVVVADEAVRRRLRMYRSERICKAGRG